MIPRLPGLPGNTIVKERNLKLIKQESYVKTYTVKTAAKNPWILYVRKAPAVDKYKDEDSIHVGFVTYYYGQKGLTVFNISPTSQLQVYYGHFFKRYNERMNRNLSAPIDIVKSFFFHNAYAGFSVIKKHDKDYTIGFSREGILLGELQHDKLWLVNKTFVSRDLSRQHQDEEERVIIAKLRKEIDKAMLLSSPGSGNIYNRDMSIIKAIEGACAD